MDFRTRLDLQQLLGRDLPSMTAVGMPESPTAPHEDVQSSETATNETATMECACAGGLTDAEKKDLADSQVKLKGMETNIAADTASQIAMEKERDQRAANIATQVNVLKKIEAEKAAALVAFETFRNANVGWTATPVDSDTHKKGEKLYSDVAILTGEVAGANRVIDALKAENTAIQKKIDELNANLVTQRENASKLRNHINDLRDKERGSENCSLLQVALADQLWRNAEQESW